MKTKLYIFFLFAFLLTSFNSHAQFIIITIAGHDTGGFSGDGGYATSDTTEMRDPSDVLVDDTGNVIIADYGNGRVRKINSQGIITTIAGVGVYDKYTGDGGPATAANFDSPIRMAIDDSNNLFISDVYNHVIRKINTKGIITTVAGNGYGNGTFDGGYSGDGGPATAAELDQPFGLAVYKGNIYIGDEKNYRIRKVDTNGIITTFAGNGTFGYTGDGGQATDAEITQVTGIAVDDTGNIYFADYNYSVIRKINTNGIITTAAGNGTYGYNGDGIAATTAELRYPKSVSFDLSGNMYIADEYNNLIREVNTNGVIYTIAGDTGNARGTGASNSNYGYNGNGVLATHTLLYGPTAATPDKKGNVFIADQSNLIIRELTMKSTGISQLSVNNDQLLVYPNPNNGNFIIQLQNVKQGSQIQIFNVLGENINTSILNSTTTQINLSDKPAGIYLFRIITQDGQLISTGKVMIE